MDNASQMAAAIAYHVLFAVVPLTMFVVSVIGLVAGTGGVQARVADDITDYLQVGVGDVVIELDSGADDTIAARYGPEAVAEIEEELSALNASEEQADDRRQLAEAVDAGQPVSVAGYALTAEELAIRADNLVAETLRGVVNASGPLSIVSFLMLAYAASGLFGAIRRSLDFVWDVDAGRPMVQAKLVDLAMLVGLLLLVILFGLSIAATATWRALYEAGNDPFNLLPDVLSWALALAIPWFLSFLFCLFMFQYVPRVRNKVADVWPGAVLVATGFELLKQGYGVYVANFGSYDVVYGALGGILLFMFFVYLSGYVFLFGAELASEFPRVMRGDYDTMETGTGQPTSLRRLAVDAVRGLFVTKRG